MEVLDATPGGSDSRPPAANQDLGPQQTTTVESGPDPGHSVADWNPLETDSRNRCYNHTAIKVRIKF